MAVYHLKHSHLKPMALPQSKNNKTFILENILFLLNSFKQFKRIEKQSFFFYSLSYSFSPERVLILIFFQSKPPIWQNLHLKNFFMYAHRKIISKIALVFIYSDIFKRKTQKKKTTQDKRCIMLYWILGKKPIQVDSKALGQKPLE